MSRDIESEVAGFRRHLEVNYTVHVVFEEEFDNYVRRHAGSSWSFVLREDGSREYSVPGFPEFVVHGVFKRKPDCPEAIEPFLLASTQLDQETIVQSWLWRSDVLKNLKPQKLKKGYAESLKILEHVHPGHALHVIANVGFLEWALDKKLLTQVSGSGVTYKLRNGREVVIHCTYTGAAHSWNWVKGGGTSGPEWEGVVFGDFSDSWDYDPRGYDELGEFLDELNKKEASKAKNLEVRKDTKEMAEEAIYQAAVTKLRDNARSGRILHTAMRHEFLDRLLKKGVLTTKQSHAYKGAAVYGYPGVPYSEVAVHATYDGRLETPSLWVGGESPEYCKAFKEGGWAFIGRDWQYDTRSQSELGKFLVEMNSGTHAMFGGAYFDNKTSGETAEPAEEKDDTMNKNEFGKVALRGVAGAAIDMAVTEIGVALIKEHPESAEFLLSPLGRAVLMMAMFGATETVARATGASEDSTAAKVLGVMSEVFVSEGARAATTGVAKPLMAGGHWVAKTLGATLPKLRAVNAASMMSDDDSNESSSANGTV